MGRSQTIHVNPAGGSGGDDDCAAIGLVTASPTGAYIVEFDTVLWDTGGYAVGIGTSGAGFAPSKIGKYLITMAALISGTPPAQDFYGLGVGVAFSITFPGAGMEQSLNDTRTLYLPAATVLEGFSVAGEVGIDPAQNPLIQFAATFIRAGGADVTYDTTNLVATIRYKGPLTVPT